jgi:hypothetical protein
MTIDAHWWAKHERAHTWELAARLASQAAVPSVLPLLGDRLWSVDR